MTAPQLSFIMPVKDVEPYIQDVLRSLQSQSFEDWELVAVDDHSTDATAAVLKEAAVRDLRIRFFLSPGHGRLQAINHGFDACCGHRIKLIEGDDFLPGSFSEHLGLLAREEATYHDAYLLREGRDKLRPFLLGPRFAKTAMTDLLRRLIISPPLWSWTLSRAVAERIFPLPADLPSPHEDVYLGLKLKQNSRIAYIPLPLYVFRQRPGQSCGGVFNFSSGVVTWRAKAMLRVIELVKTGVASESGTALEDLLATSKVYYGLLAEERLTARKIFQAELETGDKLRVALIRKAPGLASVLSRWLARRRGV